MQTLLKFLPILLAMFLAQPVVAQNNYVQLIFYNHDTSGPDVNYTPKPIRRSPTRIPSLPTCYFDGETITFYSDAEEYVLDYFVMDFDNNSILSETIVVTPNQPYHANVGSNYFGGKLSIVINNQVFYANLYNE